MYLNQDKSYLDEPREDIDFDRMCPPPDPRPFKRSFFNVRNRKHMEAIIKQCIDKNIEIKDRLDYSDRFFI